MHVRQPVHTSGFTAATYSLRYRYRRRCTSVTRCVVLPVDLKE
jgi:hypothetical protein